MKKNNKTCIVCGEKYTYCNSCEAFYNLPTWMAIFHNENCKDLFTITSDYLSNTLDKDEAIERLNKCDLSYKDKLHKEILKAVNELTDVEIKAEVIEKVEITEANENIEEVNEIEKYVSKRNKQKKNLNSDYNEGI